MPAYLPRYENIAYLDLLEKTLLYSFWPEPKMDGVGRVLESLVTDEEREFGEAAWPTHAFTMVGRLRLRNIRELCFRVLADNIPGGFAECGVWRGGACIYARACLPTDRTVYVCDSFRGFPPDEPETGWVGMKCLAIPENEVQGNFERFSLTDNVRFVTGWFSESLRQIPEPLALLRIDADSYRSTSLALRELYPKLSPGGFAICDDYNVLREAQRAVKDCLGDRGPELHAIDRSGVWWRKE